MALLKSINEIPEQMAKWEMRYERHPLTFNDEGEKAGKYAVVKIEKSPIVHYVIYSRHTPRNWPAI